MQETSNKNPAFKRYQSDSQIESDPFAYNNKLFQEMLGSKSKADQNQSLISNLTNFQKSIPNRRFSNQTSDSSQKLSGEESCFSRQSEEFQKQSKRNLIYGNQTLMQKQEQDQIILTTTAQSNNDLFSMIFLNKSAQEPKKSASIQNEPSSPLKRSQKIQREQIEPIKIEQQTNSNDPHSIKITDFQLGKKLGSGKFGQVHVARHKETGFFCAIKKIQRSKIDNRMAIQLMREIKIQSFLNHPNIVKLYSSFSDKQFIYLAMQLCYSGQLYGYLRKKRRLGEDITKCIISQICRALDYMHQNEILHRDLKPQNIIYQSGLVKICDFGWSISSSTMRGTFCGTPLYVSPQLLKRKNYNNKIDVWSVGIMTYELVFGRVPFEIENQRDFVKIVQDQLKFSKVVKISDEAKDFILNCLQKDPNQRMSVPELLQHVFLIKTEAVPISDMH